MPRPYKIRIPITRSGSSILASILTQAHRNYKASLTPEQRSADSKAFLLIWTISATIVLLFMWFK